ncbi:MAG TPA: Gfo/Idh/MocA family oxidoreductase [Bacteroidales bacterium]|nr:Gfo/Idh/MocA family oxidoreductase [Bacteroidales bacterium]
MTRLIHTGIIGFGLSGKVFHAPFIHSHPGFHLSAIVERRSEHSKEFYPYVSVVSDYQNLLEDDSLELVVVATPNIFHYPMARDCMLAGKHVVIEKPFTPSSREAEELISISKETGKKIFVYQNRRWDGDFLTIRKLLEEKALGEISYYEAHFDRYSPELKPNAWRDEDIPGGGILFDLGSHLIDQALVLFGMPDALRADIRKERQDTAVDDSFNLELFYPDKNILLTAGMMVKKTGPRYIVEGTDADFVKYGIDPQESLLKAGLMPVGDGWGCDDPALYGKLIPLNGAEGAREKQVETLPGNYMAFYDNVYGSLVKNNTQSVTPEEARNVIFIIEKAFESRKMNCVIKINNEQQ